VLLMEEARRNLGRRFDADQQQRILDTSPHRERLEAMPVNEYVGLYALKASFRVSFSAKRGFAL